MPFSSARAECAGVKLFKTALVSTSIERGNSGIFHSLPGDILYRLFDFLYKETALCKENQLIYPDVFVPARDVCPAELDGIAEIDFKSERFSNSSSDFVASL